MAFDNNFIDELKNRVNIVDVIGREVSLKKAGSSYKGLCPFHSEKTPSFNVNEEHQYYHCFGCGAKGDVIRFVEQYNRLPFMDAVEKLCEDYGIKMPERGSGPRVDYEKYYEINRKAAKFFFRQLTSGPNEGYNYIRRRGIKDETIAKFGLGYAPDSWNALLNYMEKEGVSTQDLLKLGLIKQGAKGCYDKFRKRVIFPIINTNGRVIGFGGRALGDGTPKYLNSSESDIFLKKNNLYALNITKKDISDEDKVLMVEGYMDVISLYQSGVRNVTASLGTALTENQGRLVSRYTKNVILSYDADNAGIAAAMRGIDIIQKAGCRVRILQINDGKDPDEFVQKNGREAFLKLIRDAVPATDFRLQILRRGYDLTSDEQVLEYIRRCVPVFEGLSPVEKDMYIRKLAKEFHLSEYAISGEIRADSGQQAPPVPRSTTRRRDNEDKSGVESRIDLSFLVLAIANREYVKKIKRDGIRFRTALGDKLFSILQELAQEEYPAGILGIDPSRVYNLLDPEEESRLKDAMKQVRIGADDEVFYQECLVSYQLNQDRQRKAELQNDLSTAEKMGNDEDVARIAQQLIELQQQMQNRKKRSN